MLRENIDRLRSESRNRNNRDARSYYLDDEHDNYERRDDYRDDRQQNLSSRRESYDDQNRQMQQRNNERGWLEKAGDEVSSWAGDRDATRRREMDERREQAQNTNYSSRGDRQQFVSDDYMPVEANPDYPTNSRVYQDSHRENQRRGLPVRETQEERQDFRNQSDNRRDAQNLRARDVMSTQVATVRPNDSVQHAARLMRDSDVGAIPVTERNGRMIGMVTDRDITVRIVASGVDIRNAQVQDCMTDEVFACHENDNLQNCINEMTRHQVRRLAVLDNQERLVGIISQGDLARYAQNNRRQHDDFTNMVGEISEPGSSAYR